MTAPLALGVLASGSGTNLEAVLQAIEAGELSAEVRVVVVNVATAGALSRARRRGISTVVLEHKAYADRRAFDAAVVEVLRRHGVAWVVLAGFMRIVTEVLLDAFPHRVVNVHPSLLPAFPGVDAQAQAFAYGVRVTGCTVHLVDAGMDTGPILAQTPVLVADDDDVATLRARILAAEHALLPRVLSWIADGRIDVVTPEPTSGNTSRPRVRILPRA